MKLGRNELCHCGSGRKYKNCCLDKEEKPWVLEINCNPSFYGFYNLSIEETFSFEDFIVKILEIAN